MPAPRPDDCASDPARRTLLKTAVLVGAASAVVGIPVASYVAFPGLTRSAGRWFNFGPAEKLGVGTTMLLYRFVEKDGWMVLPQQGVVWAKNEGSGQLTVFSSVCPHLGCTVNWHRDSGTFQCPCHSASFDVNGQPVSGPPTRRLEVLQHRIEDGNLLVLLRL